MAEPKKASEYTKFQLFVLIYLYARQVEEGTLMESDFYKRVKMTVKEFGNLAPPDILPNTDVEIRRQLDELRESFLITDTADKYYLTNTNGVIYVRKYLYYLASNVPSSHEVSNLLDRAKAKKAVKGFFTGLWPSLKGRSQDEMANTIVTSAKHYGTIRVTALAQVFQQLASEYVF